MKTTHAVNDNQIAETRNVWQPRIGRDLSDEDARQINANITGFFATLAAWVQAEMPDPANDASEAGDSESEEAHDDR